MPRTRKAVNTERSEPPATTLEARENQLILLATNLAEQQLRDGTASSQVISHYLKLGSTRERLEQDRLRQDNELSRAKTEKIQADRYFEQRLEEAMAAFRTYHGGYEEEDYDD